jgi:hypothetical protein
LHADSAKFGRPNFAPQSSYFRRKLAVIIALAVTRSSRSCCRPQAAFRSGS